MNERPPSMQPGEDDAEPVDAERLDAVPIDAVPIDAEFIDVETVEVELIDVEAVDAGTADAESIEAGFGDAGFGDAGFGDAEPRDGDSWGAPAVIDVDAAPDDEPRGTGASARGVPIGDVVVGIAVTGVTTSVAVVRSARRVGRPVGRLMMRPPLVPSGLQPAAWIEAGARRGAAQSDRAGAEMSRLLDALVPMVVDQVVRRIDLTNLVAQQVDLNVVIQRVDLVGVIEQVLDTIDLPEIIRESTGSVASETVRGARMQSIAVDEAINRTVDRLLFRRNRPET